MKEIFQEAGNSLDRNAPFVVTTVVRTKGSTPQKPGAKLLVRDDGTGVGTLGGGCVEGDLWFASKELMKRGGPAEHKDYELNEELAASDGLVCGGMMYFLMDPIHQSAEFRALIQEIEEAYEGGPAVALASLIKPGVDNELPIGTKLLIRNDGSLVGTLGSEKLDRAASLKAVDLMAMGENAYLSYEDGTEYFVEAYTTPPQIVLCGGGHVSKAIAPLADSQGFRIFVTDDRIEFANRRRFPQAEMLVTDTPEEAFPKLSINPNTFIIIATRGHRYDNVALEAASKTTARYVGLLGSRRKTIMIYEDLIRSGVPLERVKEIRSPIGLDIHARTPEEIALSIMAEVLMFRLGGTGNPMKLEEWRIDRLAEKVRKNMTAVG